MSDCFYHTGRPAVTRCKQCGRPLCGECKIVQQTGIFCSEKCADRFKIFVQRAQELEAKKTTSTGMPVFIKIIIFLIIFFIIYTVVKRFLF